MKSLIFSIILMLLFLFSFTFGAKNQELITINFLVTEIQTHIPTLLSLTFFAGFLLAWLFAAMLIVHLKIKLTQLTRRLKKHELASATTADEASLPATETASKHA